jgi:S1-C subfamily serine protease
MSIDTTIGSERAIYGVSSVDGNCGAPVVNVDGKVIGFHNFTNSVTTGFIPITDNIVMIATGNRNFQ